MWERIKNGKTTERKRQWNNHCLPEVKATATAQIFSPFTLPTTVLRTLIRVLSLPQLFCSQYVITNIQSKHLLCLLFHRFETHMCKQLGEAQISIHL